MVISSSRQDKIKKVVTQRQSNIVIVLEDIHDPHNAAAIIRTCDSFGIQDVYFIFGQEEAYNPKKIGRSSSSSANKWLDFKIFDSIKAAILDLKRDGYQIIGTALEKDSVDFYQADFTQDKLALIVGNEHRGMSAEAIELFDQVIEIPMRGFVQSLNVSVSAGILIAEITRQRLANGKLKPLSSTEQQKLIADFLER